MLMTKQRPKAIRTLRGWATSVLKEAGAIRKCEEYAGRKIAQIRTLESAPWILPVGSARRRHPGRSGRGSPRRSRFHRRHLSRVSPGKLTGRSSGLSGLRMAPRTISGVPLSRRGVRYPDRAMPELAIAGRLKDSNMSFDDENHFEYALGFAVVRRWGDLSRETQELLFSEATAGDDSLREGLATFLHHKHPKTSTECN